MALYGYWFKRAALQKENKPAAGFGITTGGGASKEVGDADEEDSVSETPKEDENCSNGDGREAASINSDAASVGINSDSDGDGGGSNGGGSNTPADVDNSDGGGDGGGDGAVGMVMVM
eukprot:6206950-Pleurochrysis_carterae.AAC.1